MSAVAAHPERRGADAAVAAVEARLERVLAVHFDPDGGTPYWLERAAALGVDVRRRVRTLDDLHLLGTMTPDDLRGRPLRDFVPRRFHGALRGFVVGQTGGTTGDGVWTAYRADEFAAAFVVPFALAAKHVGFPRHGRWLYAGPSGPHVIGKVVAHLASGLGSADPFSVDFDPRWAKRLPDGSFAQERYLEHVVEQAMAVIRDQEIDVLFTTPIVLRRLAERMSEAQRAGIRGVHYGGTALARDALRDFQERDFPGAVHLSGYGNTLFGCCLELSAARGRALDYYPGGARLVLEVVGESGAPVPPGATGRVRFTRLDESVLIVRMLERDAAVAVPLPPGAPAGFMLGGVRDPHSPAAIAPRQAVGLY
jgi:phenylacetate-coenzyme A ligase PaaK-like adenylate-forming protein